MPVQHTAEAGCWPLCPFGFITLNDTRSSDLAHSVHDSGFEFDRVAIRVDHRMIQPSPDLF